MQMAKKIESEEFLPGSGDYVLRGCIREVEQALDGGEHPYWSEHLRQLRDIVSMGSELVPDWETHGVTVPFWHWEQQLKQRWERYEELSDIPKIDRQILSARNQVETAIELGLFPGVYGVVQLDDCKYTLNRQTDAALAAEKKRREEHSSAIRKIWGGLKLARKEKGDARAASSNS